MSYEARRAAAQPMKKKTKTSAPDGDGKGNPPTGRNTKTSGDDRMTGGVKDEKKTAGDTAKEKPAS